MRVFDICMVLVLLMVLSFTAIGGPARSAGAAGVRFSRDGDRLILANDSATVIVNSRTGLIDLDWPVAGAVRNAHAAALLETPTGPRPLRTAGAARITHTTEPVQDQLGGGVALIVQAEQPDSGRRVSLRLTMYDARPFVLLRAEAGRLAGQGDAVVTRQIEALAAGGITDPAGRVTLHGATDARLYLAPFDNDDDFAVVPATDQADTLSYWLTALFDGDSGRGLVAGATESRVWKSAAWFDGPTGSLSLFSGARGPADSMPHAARSADRVASAEFLIGGYADYRDGLADLMRLIALREPPPPPPALPPPLGWNPWYQYEFRADQATVRAIADFIAGGWADLGYRYVNLDAGWNKLDGDWTANPSRFPDGMAALAAYIHQRGLLAGSYFIPFSIHPAMLDQPIAGTSYTFRDAVVNDERGAPIFADILTWEHVLDGSHPAARAYLRDTAAAIAGDGFDFIKLDFLQAGTQEGVRYDPTVTAMEAFHLGMAAVREGVLTSGRPVYLSAAIAPLYVHQHVHARRVGTDVNFGQARQAQNVALSWFTDLLYHRNDPDNVVVREDWYPGYRDGVARMHATMAALGGTLFIAGDDPRRLSPERAALMTDPEVLDLAKEGVSARPVDVRETPAPIWVGRRADGSAIVGLFNWSEQPVRRTVPLARLGLDAGRTYQVADLWDGPAHEAATTALTVDLPPFTAQLLQLAP